MNNVLRPLLAVAALFLMPAATAYAQGKDAEIKQDQVKEAARESEREGVIVDAVTGAPIAGAVVTAGDKTVRTDAQGRYRAAAGTQPLLVRAVGYGRATIAASDAGTPTTKLAPLLPKALYLDRLRHRRAVPARPRPRGDREEWAERAGHRPQGRSRPHSLSQRPAARGQDRGAES